MMKLGLFSLCLGYFGSKIKHVYATSDPANATVTSETYANGEGGYEFIDVNGNLGNVISSYELEIVVSGLGFGEGPKWIQDCSYVNDGYMLIGDQYSDCVWKYYATSADTYEIECVFQTDDGAQPNGIGWNLNYPDEIWVACQNGNALLRVNISGDSYTELNRWNVSTEGYKLWRVNDVIADSQGNAYFTTYPWSLTGSESEVITGAWTVPRSTMEPELIEEYNYGQNGIAMTLDETLLVYANTMDFPAGVFDSSDWSQINYTNLYWRGYNNSGSMSTANNFTAADGFYYLWMSEINGINETYWNGASVSDGSAFDFDNNYWQTTIVTYSGAAGGWLLITDADDPSDIIGVVNFTGAGYGPTNAAKGMDGYMYITLTQWAGDCSAGEPGWGCGGLLVRIPLVNYYTSDGSNDYVLNCTNSTDDYTTTSYYSTSSDTTDSGSTTAGPTNDGSTTTSGSTSSTDEPTDDSDSSDDGKFTRCSVNMLIMTIGLVMYGFI